MALVEQMVSPEPMSLPPRTNISLIPVWTILTDPKNMFLMTYPVPPWVHVFGNSIKSSSPWTQGASAAYTEQPTNKKACHCHRNCWASKKLNKQSSLLTDATIPQSILINLISTHEINKKIIVFDGGGIDNLPIRPPNGVVWRCIPTCEENCVHICDEVDPHCELMFQWVDNVLPLFIRLPRAQSLNILSHTGHYSIIKALHACKKLKRTSLVRSYCKCVFGDYGTKVMYTCTGVKVSRRSCKVLEAAPYLKKLPRKNWRVLIRLMRTTECCFEEITNSAVVRITGWALLLSIVKDSKDVGNGVT